MTSSFSSPWIHDMLTLITQLLHYYTDSQQPDKVHLIVLDVNTSGPPVLAGKTTVSAMISVKNQPLFWCLFGYHNDLSAWTVTVLFVVMKLSCINCCLHRHQMMVGSYCLMIIQYHYMPLPVRRIQWKLTPQMKRFVLLSNTVTTMFSELRA